MYCKWRTKLELSNKMHLSESYYYIIIKIIILRTMLKPYVKTD